jgi:hypothetical protein
MRVSPTLMLLLSCQLRVGASELLLLVLVMMLSEKNRNSRNPFTHVISWCRFTLRGSRAVLAVLATMLLMW